MICFTTPLINCHYHFQKKIHIGNGIKNCKGSDLLMYGQVIGDYVIGPYFFQDNVNEQNYLNFLRIQLPIILFTLA